MVITDSFNLKGNKILDSLKQEGYFNVVKVSECFKEESIWYILNVTFFYTGNSNLQTNLFTILHMYFCIKIHQRVQQDKSSKHPKKT